MRAEYVEVTVEITEKRIDEILVRVIKKTILRKSRKVIPTCEDDC